VPRVWFRINTVNLEDYNTRLGGACFSLPQMQKARRTVSRLARFLVSAGPV
jgi:hypothetical protein